ncbi:MAG: urea carboxylase-associated family protein [Chloroflexota bacterium]|nr:urea carboxylase-associated family protein [Chloroflexota bacterium]
MRPGQAHAVEIKEGQLLQVTDVRGKQVADFVAFVQGNPSEYVSTAVTRSNNASVMLRQGMRLWSNRRTPMFELVEDTVGRHDLLFAACDAKRYEELGEEGHANCRTALTAALAPFEVTEDRIPDPVNWFMNVAIRQRGELEIRPPLSEANDRVVLRALVDALVGVSACPQDLNETNGGTPTDVLVRVYR